MLGKSPRGVGLFFRFSSEASPKKSPTLDLFFKYIKETKGIFKMKSQGWAFFRSPNEDTPKEAPPPWDFSRALPVITGLFSFFEGGTGSRHTNSHEQILV